nr:hypothetical protein [uncultured Noviherbaspirillum sp.]
MNTAVMNSSIVSVSSRSNLDAASKPGLSLRDWLNVFSSVLAMASAVPASGRVNSKQMARVRAMADAI